MNLILITKHKGRPVTLALGTPASAAVAVLVAVLAGGVLFSAGMQYAKWRDDGMTAAHITAWQAEFDRQREEIAAARELADDGIDALTTRIGRMHAHVIRLDALGQRLARMADIDAAEFDFEQVPALGGPELPITGEEPDITAFVGSLERLEVQLERRESQLAVLENLLLNRNLQDRVLPAGRPITSGWLSSHYGPRSDPFTGQRAHHGGIDFAGREGSPVIAVAAGVVTFSGPRYGYGNMVEIAHGNGYATRYAHNKENLVREGEAVRKGQQIAKMGATGRATAPHVHFEVLRDGRTVNPRQYIRASN